MSAAWWFGIAIAGLLILFIFVVGTRITVERGMSDAQWIVLVIIGLPTLFIVGVGAVLTYVRMTTMGRSVREALPIVILLVVIALAYAIVIIVFGVIPIGEATYDRYF